MSLDNWKSGLEMWRVPLLHLTSLSGRLQNLGLFQNLLGHTKGSWHSLSQEGPFQGKAGTHLHRAFQSWFLLFYPGALGSGYWAKRGKNKRMDIGNRPVVDSWTTDIPRCPASSLEQGQRGMFLDWGKNLKNSADHWGSRKAGLAQVWPKLRPMFLSRPWHKTKHNPSVLDAPRALNQSPLSAVGKVSLGKTLPHVKALWKEPLQAHRKTQPFWWEKCSDFPSSLPKALCISSMLCLFLEEDSGSGFP